MTYGVNIALSGRLNYWGIHPRDLGRWYHILTAPFLHVDGAHLIQNLLAFAVFASLCLIQSVAFFVRASVVIIVVSGVLVWLLARDAVHIGASGWIYGLWSLVVTRAWFERSVKTIVVSLIVVLLFGGMLYGLLPTTAAISYESHVFGALVGVLVAAKMPLRVKGKQSQGRKESKG